MIVTISLIRANTGYNKIDFQVEDIFSQYEN